MKTHKLLILSVIMVVMTLVNVVTAAPATLTQTVTYNGETITMRLTKENLRGANFELRSQNASGGYDTVTPVDERSYMGTVDEYAGAVSCGILLDNGDFKGAVYFDRGATWFTLGTSVVETRALDYSTFSAFQSPSAPTVGVGQAGSTMYAYELGVDADHDYYNNAGSSVATVLEGIEYSVCLVRAIYMRDVLLRPYLGRIIVRATLAHDPYTGLNQGGYLDALRSEWETNHTDTNPDLVAGTSPTKIGGGLAWVGVVGTASGYSVNQSNSSGNFDVVFRHEMGHNWDCGHFVGGSPEGTGLMGGNAAGRFSGCEVYRVLNHRNNKITAGGILDSEGTYTAIELPPYASMDSGEFVQTVTSSLTLDIMANDHDANGQTLSLVSFDSTSANGGTVTQQGQNLIYTAQGAFLGTDYFTYKITDTAGKTATGVAIIDVLPNDPLRLYLSLNETTGTAATDDSVFANTATVSGTDFDTASVVGQYGNAITLDGVDDHVAVSNVQLNANTVTMTAWIKQDASQNAWAGIIFDRSSSANGLNVGNSSELRYHWNNGQWGWNSGLTPPVGTWTFVALVIEPSKATMYMNTGSGFQVAVNNASHAPANFGTTNIGWDPSSASRHFKGGIDDARMYDYSMTQAQLQAIYDGGGAESPNPFNGATDVTSSLIRWSPGATATSYDVYVGTSQSVVANATQASPEYKGGTTSPLFVASLADQTQYYWRVDTVTASTTLTGSVWLFTTGTVQASGNAIMINFGQGSGETFSGSELIGPNASNSSHWNEGTGATGSLTGLVDSAGAITGVDVQWQSSNTWANSDGTADDEHKLSVGYLDDGDGSNGDGKGVIVTLNNIPYASYKVYGLYATDQNGSGSSGAVNFNVNGAWALGGNASTTAAAWGGVNSNNTNNGVYWTQIVPGVTQGNYWVVDSSGATCNITGELKNGSNRGCLTGVIIEKIVTQTNNAPVANNATFGVAEDVSIGTNVGTVSASDPDAGDTLSYAITAGNTGGAFAIDSNGNITTATVIDFETLAQYTLTVTVSDNGVPVLSDTATVTINITDVVEVTAPVVSTGAASGITQTGATVAYNVTDDGGEAPTVTLYYGETNGGTTPGNWSNSTVLGTQLAGAYNTAISGLTAGTAYFYTIHASNSAGVAWGSTGSFTTVANNSPKLVRMTVSGVGNGSWTGVNLGQSYNSAVIVATPIYPNSSIAPVVTRIRNVSGSSFEVKIDRTDGQTGVVSVDVSIVAVEEGVYTQANDGVTMEAVKYISTVTAAKNAWTAESRSYQNSYTSPVVVGQVMSANDADWSTFWCQGSSRTSPPNASNLNVGKHVAEDPDQTRANETVGYIVIESGSGTINGVNYTAGLGSDIVRGIGNTSSGYNYSLTGLSSATAAAASIAGMDGGDGGWAVLYGASPLSSTTLTVAVDEDQLSNSERNHTTEQLGYIVFE